MNFKVNKTYINNDFPFFELTFNEDINGCPKSHIHDRLTITALEEGDISLYLKESHIVLKEKNLAVINPYQIHSASKIDTNSKGLYTLYLDKHWIEKLQYDLFSITEYITFPKNIIEDVKVYDKFLSLCKNLFKEDFYIRKEELVIEFISELILDNCNKVLVQSLEILPYDIKSYIDENIHLNLSLEDISKQFLITSFHLIRVFKKELQLTPYQYILNKKVNLAKELLSQNFSISEVSLLAGFNDQSHLYKYFKQVFSISPKEYIDSLIK